MRLRLLGLGAVLAIVASACGGGGATTAPTAAPAGTPAPTAAPAAAAQLNVTRLSDVGVYVFHPARFQTGNQYMIEQLVFNSLVKADADEHTIIPDLADSWTVSPDASVFTFKLHPGVKWHDGEAFTADDVIYTVATTCQWFGTDDANTNQLWVGTYPATNWLSVKGCEAVKGTTNTPEGVKAVDANTVEFTLAAPNAEFLSNLRDPAYMIMPKHLLSKETPATLNTSAFATAPVGTGPYKWVKMVQGQYIEFDANADYFKGAPNIKKIFWKDAVKAETAAAQLESGDLDLVFDLPPTDLAKLNQNTAMQTFQIPGVGQETLQFNFTNKLAQDVRIRQAIYYGFDRRSLLKNQRNDAGRILWISAGFNPDGPGLDKYEFDLEKAKGLVQAAIKDNKFDATAKFPVIYIGEGQAGWPEEAAAVAEALKAIGITNVELQPSDASAWTARLAKDDYAMTLQCCGSPGISPDRDSTLYNGKSGTFYKNDDLTAKFDAARAMGDAAARAKAYEEIAQVLNKDVPYNWLWAVANSHGATKRLGSFTLYPNARESFSQIEKWTLQGK